MKPDLHFRTAQFEDISQIRELFRSTIIHVNSRDYEPDQISAWSGRADLANWGDKINNQYFLVAILDQRIVGFASLQNGTHVDLLFVQKDHQGKGIASSLLGKLEEKGESFLTTEASITAKPFFERQRFRVVQEQTVFAGDVHAA